MIVKTKNVMFRNDEAFPLRVKFEMQPITAMHSHEFVEIVVVLSGKGIHTTSFESRPIERGDVLVIPPGGVHAYDEADNLELMNVLFDPSRLPMPILDMNKLPGFHALFAINSNFFESNRYYPAFHIGADDFEPVKVILQQMKTESELMNPAYRLCFLGYFMALLGNLCRFYVDNHTAAHETAMNISKVINFLNTNYSRKLRLEEIIVKVGMSRSAFMRQFVQATGTSPIDYLLQIRMANACRLLRSTEQSISEIGYQVGFNDSNYFSRMFNKIIGQTAREYRKHQNL
ncbi:MAG: hypothetical protein A2017_15950 [Lentisphaerae bacterium GWF2_44_16]|nr:MAG: hypothetical protein A2017_15950 [Lentisphaerae bacterium GWF2_44_16]